MKLTALLVIAIILPALTGCTEDVRTPSIGDVRSDALPVFIRNSVKSDVALEALIQGKLVIDRNGCLRIDQKGPFVIWHFGSRIERTDDGRIKITDGNSGNSAHVGDDIAMGGGQGSSVLSADGQAKAPTNVTSPIPQACTFGDIWWAGRLMTESERQWISSRH